MEKIQAQLVIEILGRPAEHITDSLKDLVEKLGSEKGVKILDKTIHEPRPIEKSDLFTTFADIMVEFDSIPTYLSVVFAYMPSNIEIISPENLTIKNSEFTDIGNSILAKLHQYDSLTKAVMVDRENLLRKLKDLTKKSEEKLKKENEKKSEEKEK